MNILVTNNQLNRIGGSETFTFTIIEELIKQGHDVEYFTFVNGFVSNKIEELLGVSFMSKDRYDLILANHNTTVNKLYKKGFIIQTCHGIFPKLEQPSPKANAYVSISQEVQDHLAKLGFPSILIHNSINLERFRSKNKINKQVQTVLSLCHSEEANSFVKDVCIELGLKFKQAYKYKDPVWNIENKINKSDLVVGLGRSAYEAMACGRPVVIYDNRKYFPSCGDGYVKEILGFSIKNNCSGRYLNKRYLKSDFIQEVLKYDPFDSEYLRKFTERELDVKKNILKYLNYAEFIKNRIKTSKRNRKIKFVKKIIGNKNFNHLAILYKKI
jgi:glycosyltransferase involved in cell wall biosynthesis